MPNQVNVYISNWQKNYDLEPARSHLQNGGKFIPITRDAINIFNIENLLKTIRERLHPMGRDDWLILSGNSVVSALVLAVASHRFRKVNLLIWDARAREYVPRRVVLEDILDPANMR